MGLGITEASKVTANTPDQPPHCKLLHHLTNWSANTHGYTVYAQHLCPWSLGMWTPFLKPFIPKIWNSIRFKIYIYKPTFYLSDTNWNLSLSLSLWPAVYRSRRWMPSAPVPWVHPCWQGHAPSLRPRPLSNAQQLAPRAWSSSGAKMPAACTLAPCLLMTWSTHYRWRTRTTGGVDTHTHHSYIIVYLMVCTDWHNTHHNNSSQIKLRVIHLGKKKKKRPKLFSHCISSSYISMSLKSIRARCKITYTIIKQNISKFFLNQ